MPAASRKSDSALPVVPLRPCWRVPQPPCALPHPRGHPSLAGWRQGPPGQAEPLPPTRKGQAAQSPREPVLPDTQPRERGGCGPLDRQNLICRELLLGARTTPVHQGVSQKWRSPIGGGCGLHQLGGFGRFQRGDPDLHVGPALLTLCPTGRKVSQTTELSAELLRSGCTVAIKPFHWLPAVSEAPRPLCTAAFRNPPTPGHQQSLSVHAPPSWQTCQAWEWIKGNPAKRSKPDIGERAEAPTLTVDQLRTLYFAAADEDEDMAAAIALGALTGCRRGELCGLQWGDVDWQKASIRVERGPRPNVWCNDDNHIDLRMLF